MAENNIPLAFSNHLSRMLPKLFPDSKIAQKYSTAATKTTCVINGAIAPHFLRETVNIIKCSPFSLLTDGSNDSGLEKMNPLTVKICDVNSGRVESRFWTCMQPRELTQRRQHQFSRKSMMCYHFMAFHGANVWDSVWKILLSTLVAEIQS